jgi:putative ABC transport system permease protein
MLRNYLKTAWNVLRRRRFFTAVSLFGIALTLAVLTIGAALFDEVFAARAPEVNQDRTLSLVLAEMSGEHMRRNGFPGYGLIDRYARDLPGVERVAVGSMPWRVASFINGSKVKSYLKRTDAEFWQVLSFDFLEGGPFNADDVSRGRHVAVINASTRDRFFGAGATAVGRSLEADGQTFTVVGVVADVPMLRILSFGDLWVPHTTAKTDSYKRALVSDCFGFLLLRPGADPRAVQQEFKARLATVELPDPKSFNRITSVPETWMDAVARVVFNARDDDHLYGGRLLAVLGAGVLLFMLLPAINLVNLNTSRILERASEIGVRKAFGASSWTLIGQFLIENLLLTLIGGLLGIVASAGLLWLINSSGVIPYAQLRLNVRVFAWGLGFAAVFALLSGAYPAWRMSRLHPVDALRGGVR